MLQSADLEIDLNSRQVFKNGKALQLHSLTFDLLLHLILAAPMTVSSQELLAKVWSEQQVSPETLTQRIALLRKALLENKDAPYIQSVRGKGYRWSHPVTKMNFEPKRKLQLVGALVALCLLIGGYFIWFKQETSLEKVETKNEVFDYDSADELVKQAWNYYRRFDHKNNLIAIDLFKKKLRSDPDNVNALIGLSAAYSQETTKFNQDHNVLADGHTLAKRAVELAPNNAEAWWSLGFNLDAQGRIGAAMQAYHKAIAIAPDDLSVKSSLAYLLTIDGKLAESFRFNLEAFKSNAHFRHTQLAQTLTLLQFSEVAESWHLKAVQINPDSIFAAVEYARYLFSQGRLSESKQLIETALKNDIKRAELLIILSQIQLLENDRQASISSIQIAKQIAPHNSQVEVWSLWLQLSEHPAHEGEIQTLWQQYTNEVSNDDFWPSNLISLAMLAMVKQEHEQAAEFILQAYRRGFRDAAWLKQTPVFKELVMQPKFIRAIESIQTDIKRQRQIVLDADWLPQDFLNPKKH